MKKVTQTDQVVADIHTIPPFTYDDLLRKAKTVNVIWFNKRHMPSHFFEVEHTTDIKNSLGKYHALQDFSADFYIVAAMDSPSGHAIFTF